MWMIRRPGSGAALAALAMLTACAAPEDAALTYEIRHLYAHDLYLAGLSIDVYTYQQTVYLRGSVPTGVMIDAAGQVAASVKGVQKVQNDIHVENAAGF